MPRRFIEPEFTWACLRLADAVSEELIRAADEARAAWVEIAAEFESEVIDLHSQILTNARLFRTPLVWNFAVQWAQAIRWPKEAMFRDGIRIGLPADIVAELKRYGRLDSVEFFLASINADCCAQLGSNDLDLQYGLYINVPAWIQIGVVPQFRESFARQIRMVVFHETAHFRYIGQGLRGEFVAHARGVASLRENDWPVDRAGIVSLLEREHPEAWTNEEIRGLINDTKGGARLLRAWAWRISKLRGTH